MPTGCLYYAYGKPTCQHGVTGSIEGVRLDSRPSPGHGPGIILDGALHPVGTLARQQTPRQSFFL